MVAAAVAGVVAVVPSCRSFALPLNNNDNRLAGRPDGGGGRNPIIMLVIRNCPRFDHNEMSQTNGGG